MAEIGSAYVSILPSTRGFGTSLSRQTNPQLRSSGAAMGAGLGRSMLKGFIAIGIGLKISQFLGDSITEGREANKVAAATAQIIKTTGGAAKVTAVQVEDLATAISLKTGIDDEAIQSGQNMLLTFKNVRNEVGKGNDVFNRATEAMLDMSSLKGMAGVEGSSKALGKALNDPIAGITALGRAGIQFTEEQKELIKGFVASGQVLKAQKIILGEVESQVGGLAEAQATAGDKAKVAYANLKEQIGKALIPALDSLAATFSTKIAPAISGFITNLQTGEGSAGRFGTFIREQVVPKLREFGDYILTKVIPAVRDTLPVAMDSAKTAFNTVRDAIQKNRPQLEQLWAAFKKVADFVLTKLIPAGIKIQSKMWPVIARAVALIIGAAALWVNAFNKVRAKVEEIGRVISGAVKFFKTLKEGAERVLGNLLAFIRAIPGKIKGFFNNLPGALERIGGRIIDGLASGVRTAAHKVYEELQKIVDKIQSTLKNALKIKSPSKVTEEIGRRVGDGLAKGIADSAEKVGAATEKLGKKVKEKVTALRETLSGLKSDFASLVDPIKSAFTGDLFSAETASGFVASLMGTKGQLSGLIDAFKTLIGQGLNPKFLYDLFQSGNAGLILDLAKNPELAAQAGGLFGDINQLSTQLGQSVAGATPDGKAITAKIDKTNAKLDKLIDAVEHSADRTGDKVNGAAAAGRRRGKRGGRRAA